MASIRASRLPAASSVLLRTLAKTVPLLKLIALYAKWLTLPIPLIAR